MFIMSINFCLDYQIVINYFLQNRFVQFTDKECGPQQLGVQLQSGDIVSISALDPQIPNSLRKFIEGGEELLEKAQQ